MVRTRSSSGLLDLLRDLWLRRALSRVPAFELDALPENVCGRVTGVVRPLGPVLEAPLSGRPCVYYAVTIRARHRQRNRELAWEDRAVNFVLEARGQRVVIEPSHAKVSARYDFASTSKAAFDADPRQRGLLERHRLVQRDWFWTDWMRYEEAVIAVDQAITVMGAAVRVPDPARPPEALYRGVAASQLWLRGSARFPIVIRAA